MCVCDGRGFCVPLNFWALVPDGSLNEALFRVGFSSKNKKKNLSSDIRFDIVCISQHSFAYSHIFLFAARCQCRRIVKKKKTNYTDLHPPNCNMHLNEIHLRQLRITGATRWQSEFLKCSWLLGSSQRRQRLGQCIA